MLKQFNSLFFTISFLMCLTTLSSKSSFAQIDSIAEIEETVNDLNGLDKLIAFNKLTAYYDTQSSRKALKYGRQAVTLGENIFVESNSNVDQSEHYRLIESYYLLGKVLFYRESYMESKKNFVDGHALSEALDNQLYSEEIDEYLRKIQALIESGEAKENFFNKAFANMEVGEIFSEKSKDININSEISKAEKKEEQKEFQEAIDHYGKAINLLRDKGDSEQISVLQLRIAILLDSLDQHEEAQKYLGNAIAEMESVYQLDTLDLDSSNLTFDYVPYAEKERKESLQQDQQLLNELAESYANEKDKTKSQEYYELYVMLEQKMKADSLNTVNERRIKEDELVLLKQQKQIADFNVKTIKNEKEEEIKLRNTSAFIALLILIGTLITLYFYLAKRKEHHKLTITYSDLDKAKSKLVLAEHRIRKLLGQQLSDEVAHELIEGSSSKVGENRFVCIMFLDIRDFTPMAEKMSPEELISFQNNAFGFMIDIVQANHGITNQFLGDGFMATFGAPKSHGNDCQNALNSSEEILKELRERVSAGILIKTKIGIGLHAGNVVTGNVGNDSRKQYSVTGNAVIIASRVEQLNKEYKTQLILTDEVYTKLDHKPPLKDSVLDVFVKGRSKAVKIYRIH